MNRKYSNTGASLVSAIVAVTFFTALVLILATQNQTGSKRSTITVNRQRAFYLAESGIEYGIRHSKQLNDWNWSKTVNFDDGKVKIEVDSVSETSSLISATGITGITAARSMQLLRIPNIVPYALYISGSSDDVIGGDQLYFKFEQENIPEMDTDSLEATALNQGESHYFAEEEELNDYTTSWDFWSDPDNHLLDASIMYFKEELKIKKNTTLNGILVLEKNLVLDKKAKLTVNGVLFFASSEMAVIKNKDDEEHDNGHDGGHDNDKDSGKSNDKGDHDDDDHGNDDGHGNNDDEKKSIMVVNGAIVGNVHIKNGSNFSVSIYHDPEIVDKFYTYGRITRESWTRDY